VPRVRTQFLLYASVALADFKPDEPLPPVQPDPIALPPKAAVCLPELPIYIHAAAGCQELHVVCLIGTPYCQVTLEEHGTLGLDCGECVCVWEPPVSEAIANDCWPEGPYGPKGDCQECYEECTRDVGECFICCRNEAGDQYGACIIDCGSIFTSCRNWCYRNRGNTACPLGPIGD
jgi:hypothetical protein